MGKIFMVIGVVLLISANIIGIGYGLYLWGGEGLAFGLAVWTAFKLWLGITLTSFIIIGFGMLTTD